MENGWLRPFWLRQYANNVLKSPSLKADMKEIMLSNTDIPGRRASSDFGNITAFY